MLNINGAAKGIIAAEEDINYGKISGTTKFASIFENVKVTDTTSKNAIDYIFTNAGRTLSFFNAGDLSLLLTDLANLKALNGHLSGTVQ